MSVYMVVAKNVHQGSHTPDFGSPLLLLDSWALQPEGRMLRSGP